MQIIDVCCRWAGSAHDATIFTNSNLYQRFDEGEFGRDSVILGDSAYAPDYFMCKPHRNPVTESERRYQECQIKTRNIAERTFGVLKERFACLSRGMAFRLNKVQDIILACCILHNLIKQEDTIILDRPVEPNEMDLQAAIGRQLLFEQQNQRRGRERKIQSFLINSFF